MLKGNFEERLYVYVAYIDDNYYEWIQYVADTLQEMSDYLGITLSATSRLLNRTPERHIKTIRIEKVKIYDYVYVIYEESIKNPLFVARDLKQLALVSGFAQDRLSNVLYNRCCYEPKRKKKGERVCKLEGKYLVKCVDLLELDINLANHLERFLNHEENIKAYEEY